MTIADAAFEVAAFLESIGVPLDISLRIPGYEEEVMRRIVREMSYIRRWLKEFADLIDERDVVGDFERAVREAQRRLKEAP